MSVRLLHLECEFFCFIRVSERNLDTSKDKKTPAGPSPPSSTLYTPTNVSQSVISEEDGELENGITCT